jgi:hypothetical protein
VLASPAGLPLAALPELTTPTISAMVASSMRILFTFTHRMLW